MPARGAFDPEAIPELWPWCFLIDVEARAQGRIVAAGSGHHDFHGRNPEGMSLTELPEATLLGQAVAFAGDVLERKVPASYGGNFIDIHGRDLLYRSILLPLGEDRPEHEGGRIVALLGGANCRVRDGSSAG